MIMSVILRNKDLHKMNSGSKWILLLVLSTILPFTAFAGLQKKKNTDKAINEYVMTINRSTMAVVDSNVVVSLQMTALQDVPATQMVVLAPVLIDTITLRNIEFPLIFLNSRSQQIYFERCLKEEYPEPFVHSFFAP